MSGDLFRHEVIESSRDRLTGTVVAATPPRARVYTALAMGVAAIMVAILLFGTYSAREQARGIVAHDSGIARVYPSAPGEVREIHVRAGDRVEAGAPLVTLALAQGGGLGTQLDQLYRQDEELANQAELASGLGTAEIRTLEEQKRGLAASIASLERQRALAAGQIGLAESALRRAQTLASEGAGTQRQVEDSRAQLLARRTEVEALNERIIAQRDALRTADAQIAQRRIEAERNRSAVGAQRAALAEQRAALARQDRIVLTAPVAGEVGDVGAEIGQRARPDAAIVTILPAGGEMQVWLYAPSRAVGLVRSGQEVRLMFDAFPYQRHGAGRGRVTEISRVAVDPGTIDPALGIQEPVFRIRVEIEELPRGATIAQRTLRPGMTLTANLVQERRRLWELFFNPIAAAMRS